MNSVFGTVLSYAAGLHESQFGAADQLLKFGVPVDLRWNGVSPLEWAVLTSNKEVAKALILDKHAQVDRPLTTALCTRSDLAPGSTLAHLCAKMGLGTILTAILQRDPAAKEAKNDDGLTPRQVADAALIKVFSKDHMLCWKVSLYARHDAHVHPHATPLPPKIPIRCSMTRSSTPSGRATHLGRSRHSRSSSSPLSSTAAPLLRTTPWGGRA